MFFYQFDLFRSEFKARDDFCIFCVNNIFSAQFETESAKIMQLAGSVCHEHLGLHQSLSYVMEL